MTHPDGGSDEPPEHVVLTLDEALRLLASLEEICEVLEPGDVMTLLLEAEDLVALLHRKLGLDEGGA